MFCIIKMSYLHLFAPLAIGSVLGSFCPMKTGPKTKSQPPGWVFAVVWPILYLLIGWNWMKTKNDPTLNMLHLLLVLGLNGWVYKAGCQLDYRTGAWIFVPIIGLTLCYLDEEYKYIFCRVVDNGAFDKLVAFRSSIKCSYCRGFLRTLKYFPFVIFYNYRKKLEG